MLPCVSVFLVVMFVFDVVVVVVLQWLDRFFLLLCFFYCLCQVLSCVVSFGEGSFFYNVSLWF